MHQRNVAFALLPIHAQTEGQIVRHNRAGQHYRRLTAFLVAHRQLHRTFPFVGWVIGFHHHRTGHSIAPARQALRPAQNLHLLHIPQRLRAERGFVIRCRTPVDREIQPRTRARQKRHSTRGRPGTVDTTHGGQVVVIAQIHHVGRVRQNIVRRARAGMFGNFGRFGDFCAGGGLEATAARFLTGHHDIGQVLRLFGHCACRLPFGRRLRQSRYGMCGKQRGNQHGKKGTRGGHGFLLNFIGSLMERNVQAAFGKDTYCLMNACMAAFRVAT